MPIIAALCHIIKGQELLLQKKSKGLFGADKWNGVGGKLKLNETPEDGLRREVFEETGLKILNFKFHGILNFYFGGRNEPNWIVYVFSTKAFEGMPRSSKEGTLRWFTFEEIPFDEMWQDDKHWLPMLFKGKNFEGDFYFDEEGKELLDFNLRVL